METQTNRITITDIDIPFWRLVAIMIKVVLAAIPAYIVVLLIVGAVVLAVGAIFGGLGLMPLPR